MEAGEYEDPSSTALGTGELDRTKSPEVETAVSEKRLRSLNEELLRVPDSFTIHRKLRKPLLGRIEKLDAGEIEFGHAEALAFASLLTEGTHIRLTGQDTERGTFSHRHLVLHDEKTGLRYVPIQNLSGALAPFELHNSPLSETACLGFEYGYSAASPESLILWEAQFGDFANSAQVIIDSFIVAGESKWGQTTRLTLLLPHGYEGAGPEHSSARIERFIQLGAEGNIRLANPTTAAQYFHLLRRQARIAKPRPLVVFTPEGPAAAAGRRLDARGPDRGRVPVRARRPARRPSAARRSSASSSAAARSSTTSTGTTAARRPTTVAVARVELLYPFARNELARADRLLPEPEEGRLGPGGAEEHGRLERHGAPPARAAPDGVELRYVGRPQRASPSEGYPAAHRLEQERIVLTALEG